MQVESQYVCWCLCVWRGDGWVDGEGVFIGASQNMRGFALYIFFRLPVTEPAGLCRPSLFFLAFYKKNRLSTNLSRSCIGLIFIIKACDVCFCAWQDLVKMCARAHTAITVGTCVPECVVLTLRHWVGGHVPGELWRSQVYTPQGYWCVCGETEEAPWLPAPRDTGRPACLPTSLRGSHTGQPPLDPKPHVQK